MNDWERHYAAWVDGGRAPPPWRRERSWADGQTAMSIPLYDGTCYLSISTDLDLDTLEVSAYDAEGVLLGSARP